MRSDVTSAKRSITASSGRATFCNRTYFLRPIVACDPGQGNNLAAAVCGLPVLAFGCHRCLARCRRRLCLMNGFPPPGLWAGLCGRSTISPPAKGSRSQQSWRRRSPPSCHPMAPCVAKPPSCSRLARCGTGISAASASFLTNKGFLGDRDPQKDPPGQDEGRFALRSVPAGYFARARASWKRAPWPQGRPPR
jgi:hypothetical protein